MRGFFSYALRAVIGKVGTNTGEVVVEGYQDSDIHCVGLHFLARTQPTIDWKQRVLRIESKWKTFEIKALSIADSYIMTCPVVRVAKVGEGESEAEQAVTDV